MIDTIVFGVHVGDEGDHGLTCINVPGLFTYSDGDEFVHNIREALSCYDDLDRYIIDITPSDVEDLDSEDYDCFIVFFRGVECTKMFFSASDFSYMFDQDTPKEGLWMH